MTVSQKALQHLRRDKVLKRVIDKVGPINTRKNNDLYFMLLKAIVSQQLSVKAADTIWNRFLDLFNGRYPQPEHLLRLNDDRLRSAGLSFQKAGYLKNIASFAINQTLDYSQLRKKNDEQLIEYLVQIKGVGRWTVEMVMMFGLGRPNVFPKDDLGIQNGIKNLYGVQAEKKELYRRMEAIAENWQPYRTLACRYLWRYKDMAVMQ